MLLGVLVATIVEFHKVDPTAAYLLLPYLGWSTFATALTYNIWLNNTKVRLSWLDWSVTSTAVPGRSSDLMQ